MKKLDLLKKIEMYNPRSAWSKGVKKIMFMLADLNQEEIEFKDLLRGVDYDHLDDGARRLSQYGYLHHYNYDIAKMLCTPSEFKKKKEGDLQPSKHETWEDVQGKACFDALMILNYMMN